MGDRIEVYFCEMNQKHYARYANEKTKWNDVYVELLEDEVERLEALWSETAQKEENLLWDFINN